MVYANYTLQDLKDDKTGKMLPEVSQFFGTVDFDLALNQHLNFYTNILFVDSRSRASDDPRLALDGYNIVDMTLIVKNFYETPEV